MTDKMLKITCYFNTLCFISFFYFNALFSECENDRVYQGHLSLSNVSIQGCDIKHQHGLQLKYAMFPKYSLQEFARSCLVLGTFLLLFVCKALVVNIHRLSWEERKGGKLRLKEMLKLFIAGGLQNGFVLSFKAERGRKI